ncbi:hypothetical protein ACO0K0_03790 [Undibacterium sp. SXout11W]|uniref:hypothetical protein n=1 Tax=Undibacterium sp. SXout11W TaxID=3413050 RepID=UPI003BF18E7B
MNTHKSNADLFLTISVWLTGFDEVELQGTGMVDTYFQTIITKNTASCIDHFFQAVWTVLAEGGGDEEKTNALISRLLFPTSCYNNLAQNIINMWYNGAWMPDVNAPNANIAQVSNISPEAYVQSLVWPASETHPPGAKQPGYGSWAVPPVQISK